MLPDLPGAQSNKLSDTTMAGILPFSQIVSSSLLHVLFIFYPLEEILFL